MNLIIEIVFMLIILFILLVNVLIRLYSKKLQEIPSETGISGFEIIRKISSKFCEEEPHIIKKVTKFQDYYNKERNVVKLSKEVFDGEDMYSTLMAINLGLETNPKKNSILKFPSFLILTSYIIIIVSAFLNNINAIHLGLAIFILGFIISCYLINRYAISHKEVEDILEELENEKIIKVTDDLKSNIPFYLLIIVARLPYEFIHYFQ